MDGCTAPRRATKERADRMSATLAEVIGGAGEPLRWMVLTWDTAGIEGSTSQYNRFYLADDSFLASSGRRSPKVFAAIPQRRQHDVQHA